MIDYEINPDDPFGHKIAVHRRTGPIEPVDPGMAKVIVAIVAMVLVPLLYPLLTLAIVCVGWFMSEILSVRAPEITGVMHFLIVALPCCVVFVIGMRIEQRLGESKLYRWPRLILRLLVPPTALLLIMTDDAGNLASAFMSPDALYGAGFVVALTIALLFAGTWVRTDWHGALRVLRLRSSKLDD